MTWTFFFLAGYYGILFVYLFVLILLLFILKKDRPASSYSGHHQPFVSILIAARNEEDNILACLQAVAALSWPADKFEVLIGDDQSDDKTGELVQAFIRDKKNFHLYRIEENLGNAKGKANVLANLARKAKGEFFFITDADIRVPQYWIQSLLANHGNKIGIVSGATRMEEDSFFAYCQSVDWVYGFSMIKTASDCGIPVSAVGNNMMIAAEAYRSTGGYEKIPFSVTEDHALFMETLKQGWTYKNMMSPDCLAVTKPMASVRELLAQRKRWMQGAVQVPLPLLLFLFLQSLFLPIAIAGVLFFPFYGSIFWIIKIVLQQFFIILSFRKIQRPYHVLKGLFSYEFYCGLLSPLVLLSYCIPTKVRWKGRVY